jgi:hypothetical protein
MGEVINLKKLTEIKIENCDWTFHCRKLDGFEKIDLNLQLAENDKKIKFNGQQIKSLLNTSVVRITTPEKDYNEPETVGHALKVQEPDILLPLFMEVMRLQMLTDEDKKKS